MMSGAPQYRSVFEIKVNIFYYFNAAVYGPQNLLLLLTVGLTINHTSYRFDDHIATVSLSSLFDKAFCFIYQ